MSLCSADETIACLEIALDEKLISKSEFAELEKECETLSLQLGSLSKKLKASSH